MSAQAALSVSGVTADYGHGPVLDNVSFDVAPGETFGLIGLNGVGKTTLIKIALGLIEADHGNVSVFGHASGDVNVKKRLAYLPEKFEPPAFLSGAEFISFSLALYDRSITREDMAVAATRVSLSDAALTRRVGTYSKGMRQKTGLLATWLSGCPLLILDEPMSGLDPRARVQVKDELLACKAKGVTIFLSSHILADMDEMCDRVAVLHDARLPFVGRPAELRAASGQDTLERAFLSCIADSRRVYES